MSTVSKVGNLWICQCHALGCEKKEFQYFGKTYKGIGRSSKSHNAHQKNLEEINRVSVYKFFEKGMKPQ